MKNLNTKSLLPWLLISIAVILVGCGKVEQQREEYWKKIRTPKARLVKLMDREVQDILEEENRVKQEALDKLKAQLRIDEGLRTKPYFCPAGKLTVGWGRNLEANPLSPEERAMGARYGWTSKEFLNALFENDVRDVERAMREEFPWSEELDPARQAALANMIFQMGAEGVGKFERSLAALEVGDYDRAEQYLKQSKWYRQTPERAERVISQLTRGTFPSNS